MAFPRRLDTDDVTHVLYFLGSVSFRFETLITQRGTTELTDHTQWIKKVTWPPCSCSQLLCVNIWKQNLRRPVDPADRVQVSLIVSCDWTWRKRVVFFCENKTYSLRQSCSSWCFFSASCCRFIAAASRHREASSSGTMTRCWLWFIHDVFLNASTELLTVQLQPGRTFKFHFQLLFLWCYQLYILISF